MIRYLSTFVLLLTSLPSSASPQNAAETNFSFGKNYFIALSCGYPEPIIEAPLSKLFVKYSQTIPDWNEKDFFKYSEEEILNAELSKKRSEFVLQYSKEYLSKIQKQSEQEMDCSILKLREALDAEQEMIKKSSFLTTLRKLKEKGTLYVPEDLSAKRFEAKVAIRERGSFK